MTKIILCGANGKMAISIATAAQSMDDIEIVAGIDIADGKSFAGFPIFDSFEKLKDMTFDVVVDFSRPDALDNILNFCIKNCTPAVLASTGYLEEHNKKIEDAAKEIAIFKSANMSLGVSLVAALCQKAAEFLGKNFEVEIIEKHHNKKVDAPSGTALLLANSVNKGYSKKADIVNGRQGIDCKRTNNEIGVHAVRGGTIVGDHDVMFIGNDEIVTLSHHAASKTIFAAGAIKAAKYMKDKIVGIYGMSDMIGDL